MNPYKTSAPVPPAETAPAHLRSDHRPLPAGGWAGGQGRKGPAGEEHFPSKLSSSPIRHVLPLQGNNGQTTLVLERPTIPICPGLSVSALKVPHPRQARAIITPDGALTFHEQALTKVPAQRFQPSEAGLGWLLGQATSSQCGPSRLLTHPWKPTQCRACSGPSFQAFPGHNPGGCCPAQLPGITGLARLLCLLCPSALHHSCPGIFLPAWWQ